MKKINMNTWNRKDIFNHFSYGSNPFYMVTCKVDVTNLYDYVKQENLSFYYSLIYLMTKAMNSVDNFLYTIIDNEVYLLDSRIPSFTDMKKDSDLFYIVTMDEITDLQEFNKQAKEKSLKQDFFLDYSKEANNLIYVSSLPWVNLMAITNEMDYTNPKLKDDSVPRVSWGKYVEENGRKQLGLSLEVNHRFIDGIHIGKFIHALENEINKL